MHCVAEGPDGVGKTTLIGLLADRLRAEGKTVILTKEPGSADPVCIQIRSLLLHPSNRIDHRAALLLFLADRAQHMVFVKEQLALGHTVISDRGSLSTFAYHAAVDERSPVEVMKEIAPLLCFAQQIKPDITFVCSADLDWSLARLRERTSLDRIEQFKEGFHKRTHELFSEKVIAEVMPYFDLISRKIIFVPPTNENPPEVLADYMMRRLTAFGI